MKKEKIIDGALVAYGVELDGIWGNDSHMKSWCLKNHTPYMVSNGNLFLVDRPSVKTSFCFGYHTDYSGHECSDAEDLRYKCTKSEAYFKSENLAELKRSYYEVISDEKLYWIKGQRGSDKIISFVTERGVQMGYWTKELLLGEVSLEDRAVLKKAYENEIAKFTKRLDTYWKRYGSTKLRSWTYWMDE